MALLHDPIVPNGLDKIDPPFDGGGAAENKQEFLSINSIC